MKNVVRSLFLSVLLGALSGCATGPLYMHETARTVGQGHSEISGGYGSAGYVAKWNYGVSDNLDFGLQLETLSVGARMKYALINGQKGGFSLAVAGGLGSSYGGSYYSGDVTASYLEKKWEPYLGLRMTKVHIDPNEVKDDSTGDVVLNINSSDYSYGQVFLGNRIWFGGDDKWFLAIEASTLVSTGDIDFNNSILMSAGLGYRF